MARKITITDSDGNKLYGQLPEGWHEVALNHYATLAAATNVTERFTALATLVGLPAEPFLNDVSLIVPIYQRAGWLFDGPLPTAEEPVEGLLHAGVRYEFVGNLHKLLAGQYEALSDMLTQMQAEGTSPMETAHMLLAVLYKPAGRAQDADCVQTTSEAFLSLPMAIAWPAISFFLQQSGPSALSIQTYLAVRPAAEQVVATLEQALSASPASSWSLRRWLTQTWIRRVKRIL